MIPYFSAVSFPLGPLTIHVWGLMVALGICAAVWMIRRTAIKLGMHPEQFESAALGIVFWSFIGARLGHFLFYMEPKELLDVFRIWESGWSSIGGILGGTLAGLYFISRRRFSCSAARAADVLLVGFPIGMAIGRVGCFLIHDHPGTLSHFLLAVNFPGGPRHDLGLYESMAMFLLAALLAKFSPILLAKEGRLARWVATSYAVFRFPLDFLRINDARYVSLTPAQIGCIAILLVAWVPYLMRKKV